VYTVLHRQRHLLRQYRRQHLPSVYLTGLLAVLLTRRPTRLCHTRSIAEIDLELAAKMDAIPVECSPKWLREHQARLEISKQKARES